ncbi:MAG: SCO1664 family protein [Chloroflexota bacterium]
MTEQNDSDIMRFLHNGRIELDGYVPWGSNYTFVVTMRHEGEEMLAVYKPRKGERPLWDFPTGTLCNRERASYLLSEAIGWGIVPPTILRKGPQGYGSVQLYIDHDPNEHFFNFENKDDLRDQLIVITLFDLVINNADRKGGHVIRAYDNRLWAIDHGIAFHDEPKLRTVLWDFAGEPIPDHLTDDLTTLEKELNNHDPEGLCNQLTALLSSREMKALQYRVRSVRDRGVFPEPGPGRPYPWPLV